MLVRRYSMVSFSIFKTPQTQIENRLITITISLLIMEVKEKRLATVQRQLRNIVPGIGFAGVYSARPPSPSPEDIEHTPATRKAAKGKAATEKAATGIAAVGGE